MRQSITTALAAQLEKVAGVLEVQTYNKGDVGKYPAAIIVGSDLVKSRESTKTVIKTYTFKVLLVHEAAKEEVATVESRLLACADALDASFDDDDSLGGLVDDVNVTSAFGWVDAELKLRVLELTIVCRKLVDLS